MQTPKRIVIALLLLTTMYLFSSCAPKFGCRATQGMVGYDNYKPIIK